MPHFSRKEIEEALDRTDDARAESSRTGDWTIWAAHLSEDVEFYDTLYGTYRGRQAVSDFVVRVHAPFPHLRYEREWSVIDVDRGEVIFQQQMILPEPEGWTGDPFAIDVWSRQRYAGDGLWNLKRDVTLSSAQADANFAAWMAAGGRFAAPPLALPTAAELASAGDGASERMSRQVTGHGTIPVSDVERFSDEVDVIVVGCGSAGASAVDRRNKLRFQHRR